jgi:hypothetical protein
LFSWTQLLVGGLAVIAVFFSTAVWSLFHYDASSKGVLSLGGVARNALHKPAFWVLSIVAFGATYYLAR